MRNDAYSCFQNNLSARTWGFVFSPLLGSAKAISTPHNPANESAYRHKCCVLGVQLLTYGTLCWPQSLAQVLCNWPTVPNERLGPLLGPFWLENAYKRSLCAPIWPKTVNFFTQCFGLFMCVFLYFSIFNNKGLSPNNWEIFFIFVKWSVSAILANN